MAYTRLGGGRLFIYHPLELVVVSIDYIAIVINVPVLLLIVFPFLLTAKLRKCFLLLDAANVAGSVLFTLRCDCRLNESFPLGPVVSLRRNLLYVFSFIAISAMHRILTLLSA